MRSSKLFLFFITDAQGRSAYWENNIVKWSTTPRPLSFAPDGWRETQPSFTRSGKYYGINRQLTTNYKLVEDGAAIIRYLLYTGFSYESKAYLVITKWNHLTDTYETYYRGEIDFGKIVDDPSRSVTVNLIEGDLLKLINANDDTEFEVPIDGESLLQIDAINLFNRANYSVFAITATSIHLVPIAFLDVEQTLPGFIYETPEFTGFNPFFETERAQSVRFIGKLRFIAKTTGDYDLFINVLDADDNVVFTEQYALNDPVFSQTEYIYDINTVFDVPAGGKLVWVAAVDKSGGGLGEVEYLESRFRIEFNYKHETGLIKVLPAFELYQKLLRLVLPDKPFSAISNLLESDLRHIYFSSGDAIRNITNAVIKTSFAQFFDAVNKTFFAGFSISGLECILEDRRHFYDASSTTIDIGEVSELSISLDVENLYNTVSIGYPQKDIESLNGKFSFNNTSRYQLPITSLKKDLNLISPYLCDPYVIENIRINFDRKVTTDYKTDNNVFIFNTIEKPGFSGIAVAWEAAPDLRFVFTGLAGSISSFAVGDFFSIPGATADYAGPHQVASASTSGSDLIITVATPPTAGSASFVSAISFPLQLRRLAYDELAGVPADADVYNIEDLTPKRMLLRHAPYLRSLLYFLTLERIEFTTADRNKDLSTTLGTTTIAEAASVRVDTLGDPMFYPYVFTFKTEVPASFISLFNNAVNGHIAFRFEGVQLYGFPIQMTQQPGTNEAQEWKLLASPRCDLPKLVDLLANPLTNFNMATYGLAFSHLSPVQFVPQAGPLPDVYNFKHFDAATFGEQSTRYQFYRPYCAKWQQSDIIRLQCISRDLGPVQVQLLNKYGRAIGTYPLTQINTPALGSTYQLFQGDIELTDVPAGYYQLKCTAGIGTVVTFLSEIFQVHDEKLEHTLLFEYYNNTNLPATIFTTGYRPSFRIEGMLTDFSPRARLTSYEDQPANTRLLDGTPYRTFVLQVGHDFGLPPYMIDKLNRIMTLSNVSIDGKRFTRNEDAQFEALTRTPGVPSTYWTLEVREADNLPAVTLTTDGVVDADGAVMVNIDTALFGDLTNQVSSNPVQITLLEP